MRRLLLVEDEDVIRRALVRLLERHHYTVLDLPTIEAAKAAELHSFDLVLADLRLPGEPGTAIIPLVEPAPVVIMTSHASVRSAVDAMRAGATDYVAKPFDHDELLLVLERALQRNRLVAQNRALAAELHRLQPVDRHVTGTALEPLLDRLLADMPADGVPRHFFLYGEPGSGREALARAIHLRGPRAEGPFVGLDLAAMDTAARARALPPDSHADSDAIRAARHGTLMMRHPELLDAAMRQALHHTIVTAPAHVNISVISIATSSPARLVAEGLLEDETGLALDRAQEVPPLRFRRSDSVLLARRAVAVAAARRARPALELSVTAEAWIGARDWPGNLAELDHVVECAALLVASDRIEPSDLSLAARAAGANGSGDPESLVMPEALSLDEYFRWFVLRHQSSLSETDLSARLGISRKALWERRQRMRLPRSESDG